MPEEHRGRLDRAIDRAVHEMVRADPRPGLRQRVEGRIHAHARSSASMWHTRWRIPALAAAAVLAIIIGSRVVLRTPPPAVQEGERVAAVEPSPQPNAPPADAPVTAPPTVPSTLSGTSAAQMPLPSQATRRATSPSRTAEEIFGARGGLVRAADASPDIESPAAIDAGRAPGGAFDSGPSIEPLAPITISPIRLTPIVVSPVTVNAIPGGK